MIVTAIEPSITVPLIEATVAELVDADLVGRQVIITNLDIANTLFWKFQYSLDKVAYTDLAAFAALAPLAAVQVVLTNPANYHRLRAYGNLKIAVSVTRYKGFSGTFPLVTV